MCSMKGPTSPRSGRRCKMDAFEELVAEVLRSEGYWTQTSVKVELTKEEKVAIGRRSNPRWEIDVVAYDARLNEILAVECKSFLDSTGVQFNELLESDEVTRGRYKLFCERRTREVVLARLGRQFTERGFCRPGVTTRLAMAIGKSKKGDAARIADLFAQQDWKLFDDCWLRKSLHRMAGDGYQNRVSSVVAKLLLR